MAVVVPVSSTPLATEAVLAVEGFQRLSARRAGVSYDDTSYGSIGGDGKPTGASSNRIDENEGINLLLEA